MFEAKLFRSKIVAIGWFLVMNILFFLPGSALPQSHWFDEIHLDKLVHIGLFAVLVFLWCSAFNLGLTKKIWVVIMIVVIYGFLVEIIQKNWVPNRSFDLYDVAADTVGGVFGLLIWLRTVYKKNKPL